MEKDEKKGKKLKILTVICALVILFFTCVFAIGILIYGFGAENKATKFAEKFIPYPAAVISYKGVITAGEVNNNLNSIKRFYENQDFSQAGLRVDFTTSDGKKRLEIRKRGLINKMIEDRIIRILAGKNGIVVTEEMADQNVRRKMDEFGNEEIVKNNLSNLYGWTLEEFKEKIVRPDLYAEELEKLITSENKEQFSEEARGKIEKAEKELNEGRDFAEVAQKYSDGRSAEEGGELGWFKKEQLVPEVAGAIFDFKKGERSDIIESVLGFHVVEAEERKMENNEELIRIRQVFARKKIFADWLDEQIKGIKILVPLKDYYWDSASGVVQFSSEEMRNFENNMLENFQGDASIIF